MKKYSKLSEKVNIGLALGGGGGRGLAHIGVLKVLEEIGIKPKLIVGTSMGSIVGALYAYLQDAVLLETKLLSHLKSRKVSQLGLARFTSSKSKTSFTRNFKVALSHLTAMYMLTTVVTKTHVIEEEKFRELISLLLPDINIENLPVSFAAVATDLKSGLAHVFNSGPLQQATRASAAIPGIFPPVEINNTQLIDGACIALVPVEQVSQSGADFIIAVDVSQPIAVDKAFKSGIEIWLRADQITSLALRNHSLALADFTITFEELNYKWHDFQFAAAIIQAGEERTRQILPELENKLKHLRPKPWWKRIFS